MVHFHFVRKRQQSYLFFKFYLILFVVRSLFWRQPPSDPLKEIEDYCTYFNNRYGTQHPIFSLGSLSQVLKNSFFV